METVYKGRVFSVEVDHVRLRSGSEHERAVIRHGPSVVLVPIRDDGRVVLVRQYRHSLGRDIWELPAGRVESGESAEDAAARECEEEIGEAPGHIERLAALYPVPGYSDEEMIFFRVGHLKPPAPGSTHHPDEDEDIQAQAFSVDDARQMVARGDIVDLKTAYGLAVI